MEGGAEGIEEEGAEGKVGGEVEGAVEAKVEGGVEGTVEGEAGVKPELKEGTLVWVNVPLTLPAGVK